MLREVLIAIRVLVFFVHGGRVDKDWMRLPVITCLRCVALMPFSETPFCVPF